MADRNAAAATSRPGTPCPRQLSHSRRPEYMPDALGDDPETREPSVGGGRIGNVMPRMREDDISGVNVLNKWSGYRRRNRKHPPMGARRSSPLQQIQATAWRAEYRSELINLLHVLGLLQTSSPSKPSCSPASSTGQ